MQKILSEGLGTRFQQTSTTAATEDAPGAPASATPSTTANSDPGPDQSVAAIIGALQASILLGKASGTANASVVENVLTHSASVPNMTPAITAEVQSYLKTPASATVISGAVTIATNTVTY